MLDECPALLHELVRDARAGPRDHVGAVVPLGQRARDREPHKRPARHDERDELAHAAERAETVQLVATDWGTTRKTAVLETFGPDNVLLSRLIEETITEKAAVTHQLTQQLEVQATRETSKTEVVTAAKQVVHTKATEVVDTTASHQNGFAGGVLLTPAGVGPAASFRVGKLGPIGLDLTLGAIGFDNPSPRAGLMFTGEALPRVTLGVGLVLAPAGSEPASYPVLPGLAAVTLGATAQYRF